MSANAQDAPAEAPPPAGEPQPAAEPPRTTDDDARPLLAPFVPADGFRFRTRDDDWTLRVGLNAAITYSATFEPSGTNWSNFPLPFVRPRLDGNLVKPWIHYWFQIELGRFPPHLIDGFIEVERWDLFCLRAGLQYTPLSRHESFGPQQILFPEWSLTANYFWTGYERGITAYGHDPDGRFTYYAGLYDGTSTRQLTSTPGNYVLLGRVTVNPRGKVLENEMPYVTAQGAVPFRYGFTLQGDWGRTALTESNLNPSSGLVVATATGVEEEQGVASGDFVFQADRVSFITEFYYRRVIPVGAPTPAFNQLGAWAQLGYVFYKRVLAAGLRFNWVDPSLSLSKDNAFTGEAMLAWWISAPNLSLKLRYELGYQQDPGLAPANDPRFYDYVVLPLERGVSHLLSLQATISF